MERQGIFGKIKDSWNKRSVERKEEREREDIEFNAEMKMKEKAFREDRKREAVDLIKSKSMETIESNAPLGKKLAAVNEMFKDHDRPKLTKEMQELSDRRYNNIRNTEMRKEKNNLVKRLVKEERDRKMDNIRRRNLDLEAKRILNKEKMKIRRGF